MKNTTASVFSSSSLQGMSLSRRITSEISTILCLSGLYFAFALDRKKCLLSAALVGSLQELHRTMKCSRAESPSLSHEYGRHTWTDALSEDASFSSYGPFSSALRCAWII